MKNRKSPTTFIEAVLLLSIKVHLYLFLVVSLFTFVFGIARYPANNMNASIKEGDLVIYYRLDHSYTNQNLIVLEEEDGIRIQRVIARSGDEVNLIDGRLYINGGLLEEGNIYESTDAYEEGIRFPVVVKEGEVFVLSDHRTNAKDSRIYGCVQEKDAQGIVIFLLRRRDF